LEESQNSELAKYGTLERERRSSMETKPKSTIKEPFETADKRKAHRRH